MNGALDEVERRFAERGYVGGRVGPNRVVIALDPANTTQVWATAIDSPRLLSVQVRSSRRVSRELWPVALRSVNEWNRRQRLTSAWLVVDDWESSDDGSIVVEACLPVTPDHEVGQVAGFVDLAVADAARFWRIEV